MKRYLTGAVMLGALAAFAMPAWAQGSGSKTIDDIKSRGQLVCGVSTGVAGFSLTDSKGVMQGIDADTCRAVAAAILGDGNKIRFVPTEHDQPVHRAAIRRDRPAGPLDDLDARPRSQPRSRIRRR